MLCFDPTRGIDIRTKNQIYVLLRDLAEAGAAVLFYTSELKEIQLVCDRAIVIFGGRVVAEIGVADADEPTLLRAAYNLRSDAVMPELAAAEAAAEADAVARPAQPQHRGPGTVSERGSRARRAEPQRRAGDLRCCATRGPSAWSGSSPSCWCSPSSSSRTTASPASRAWRSPCCRSPWPPSPRRSSSSRAGSTSRSAR